MHPTPRVAAALTSLLLAVSLEAAARGTVAPGTPGPWDNDLQLYRVWPDGSGEQLAVFERGGVPSLIRLADGRLMAAYQWFPEDTNGKTAVRFSSDDGAAWSPLQEIALTGLPAGYRSPFDPTLVQLPDGRVRLYVTTNRAPTFDQDPPWIASAISTDGVTFEMEPGARLAVPGANVIDCAAVLHRGVFHLYAPIQTGTGVGSAYHATSSDGLTFVRQADVTWPGLRWLGAALSDGEHIRFYGTGSPGLWMAESTDGAAWTPRERIALPGADPGVVESSDGSRLVLLTGPPRPGTPSATQPRP